MTDTKRPAEPYALGHSPEETHRLQRQAAMYREHSTYLLRRAGIAPGMRVLDVGCGPGEVSLLLAELVGPTGSVLGVDMDDKVLAVGEQRVAEAGLAERIEFRQGDITELGLDERVDALAGRLVLLHLSDAAETLRALTQLVRPHGVVTFLEPTMATFRSAPAVPLAEQCRRWATEGLRAAGADPHAGENLAPIFRSAGIPVDGMAACSAVYTDPALAAELAAATVAALAPVLTARGLATADEVALDTLRAELLEQLTAAQATTFMSELVAAWGRLPA